MKYVPIGVLTFVMAFGLSVGTQAQQISRAADNNLPPLTLLSPPLSRSAIRSEGTFASAARLRSDRLPPDESGDIWCACSDDVLCSSNALSPTGQEQDDCCVSDDKDDCDGKGKGRNCCADAGGIWSNTALFFAGDGWNSIADDEDNNNFGYRAGFNSGVGIGDQPIRAQFGASYGGYNFYGREEAVNEAGAEQQVFLTGGLYIPSDVCCDRRLSGGIVWDYMHGENFGEFGWNVNLHQIRGQIGYALSDATEVGIWGAFSINEDKVDWFEAGWMTTPLSAMNQLSAYWKRNWAHGADTMAYIGGAQEPGQLALGLRGHAPLNCRVALFGNMHYIVPGTSPGDVQPNGFNNSFSEETWNITFGIVFYPGGKAASGNVSGHAGLPYQPVADNGTFAVRRPTNTL